MKPIYKPSGRAGEYAEWAINIYTGCPHRCFYCYAPSVLRRTKEEFHTHVEPRKNIIEDTKKQLERENIKGRLINLCFLCDPYPRGFDTMATREIIKAIKRSGNHVQILTKNGIDAIRDLDLLDGQDWVGVTYAGYSTSPVLPPLEEPNSGNPLDRLRLLVLAKNAGIKTWMSCEPVFDVKRIYKIIETGAYIDKFKFGKLNYHPSEIDWREFGRRVEQLCIGWDRKYYIKSDLRAEMERSEPNG